MTIETLDWVEILNIIKNLGEQIKRSPIHTSLILAHGWIPALIIADILHCKNLEAISLDSTKTTVQTFADTTNQNILIVFDRINEYALAQILKKIRQKPFKSIRIATLLHNPLTSSKVAYIGFESTNNVILPWEEYTKLGGKL